MDIELRKNVARGFAGIIARQLEPLNANDAFKRAYTGKKSFQILLNATNADYAALIAVNNGSIHVTSINNKPASNLSKNSAGWDGFLSCSTRTFFELALGRLSMVKMLVKLLTGQIKIRNISKILQFQKVMTYLT